MKPQSRLFRFLLHCVLFSAFTFPTYSWAMKCNPTDWNIVLKAQKKVDVRYNIHAVRFNQLLSIHQQRTLLHQEFTSQELQTFWHPDKTDMHLTMRTQMKATREAVEQTETEISKINNSLSDIYLTRKNWKSISQHCEQQGQTINMISSEHYVSMNQEIINDIKQLKKKLSTIKQQYLNEIAALENSYPD
ncbi:hypothetical protein DZ860_16005 [Vibrio sinensis]|uniref:ATPase n=2 Tax=Vibrio sinensis TaxID=2302434 RepID=A0A3A6QAU9_9VIBR|nr:hypothetical protein DZ860_16005 [Vibrio sinensis]